MAQDSNQLDKLWFLREEIANATIRYGYTLKYDVSLSSDRYYESVRATEHFIDSQECLRGKNIVTTGYGHIGDGNIHLNVSMQGYDDQDLIKEASGLIDPFVMNYVKENKGSVSAEHGVGLQKPNYLHYSKTAEAI